MAAAAEAVGAYTLGDPRDDSTTMGPMALPGAPGFIDSQIADATAKGARLVVGGGATSDQAGNGRFSRPALLADCDETMRAMSEETFGPLLACAPVADEHEAVKRMNDSAYGLSAAVYTDDKALATWMSRRGDRRGSHPSVGPDPTGCSGGRSGLDRTFRRSVRIRQDVQAVGPDSTGRFGLRCVRLSTFGIRAGVDAGTFFQNRCDYLDPYLAWTGAKDSGFGASLSRHGFRAVTRLRSFHARE